MIIQLRKATNEYTSRGSATFTVDGIPLRVGVGREMIHAYYLSSHVTVEARRKVESSWVAAKESVSHVIRSCREDYNTDPP